MKKKLLWVIVAVGLAVGPVTADVWDTATESDNDSNTDNELAHGTVQVHDLGAQAGPVADQDWYRAPLQPYTSFEVQMDGLTGDVNVGFDDSQLDRLDSAGLLVLEDHTCIGTSCFVKRLAWKNDTAANTLNFVRVSGQGCGTSCTTSDQYTIRGRETTVSLARFNNSGSQITVLIVQNNGVTAINPTYLFWNPGGTLITTVTTTISAKGVHVFNTNQGALVGQSGAVTIVHDGGYGQVNAKSVALEPSTGFSFDTPGVYRGN